MTDRAFIREVLAYWRTSGRHALPWRTRINPYRVLVSEIMLQQTQVDRVIPFYGTFLRAFPSFRALAGASTAELLKAWQGLGYNRRALNLQKCAREVVARHGGALPADYEGLVALPGIGPYTAGAVLAFAFDRPHPVIETNIRRVYLHHFFPRRRKVPDARLMPLVARHLAAVPSPREWYSALMDYGTHLASRIPNPNRRSRTYARQAKFEGSARQARGAVLRRLIDGPVPVRGFSPREAAVLDALQQEGFVVRRPGGILVLSNGKS